jgi:hypothetical protein
LGSYAALPSVVNPVELETNGTRNVMIALPAESRERLVTYGPSTKPRPGNHAMRGMLGSRPHQRPGSEPPLTNVASGKRFASDETAVMNRRFVPRHTFVWNY